ncbi:MAG: alkaline phosphatase [Chitinophagales bacterium]
MNTKQNIFSKSKFLILLFLIGLSACKAPNEVSTTPKPPKAEIVQNPKNIILMIGDGMGLAQVTAGMYMKPDKLALEAFKHIGLIKTHAANNLVTDSAASATAFSCGQKTYNGAIGVNTDTVAMKTILESAEEEGLETGMISTCSVTHATPASFVAHQAKRSMHEEIAADFLNAGVELVIGGGRKYFNQRTDSIDLIAQLEEQGYAVDSTIESMNADMDKFYVFTDNEHPEKAREGRTWLSAASQLAIKRLDKSKKGFFLMIEGSQIDWGGHANDSDYIITEMLDFDKTIEKVLEFVKQDGETLLLVTADHETGGYALNPGSERGNIVPGFTSKKHSAIMIPVYAYGVGAENFSGIYENTALYDKMMKALKLND